MGLNRFVNKYAKGIKDFGPWRLPTQDILMLGYPALRKRLLELDYEADFKPYAVPLSLEFETVRKRKVPVEEMVSLEKLAEAHLPKKAEPGKGVYLIGMPSFHHTIQFGGGWGHRARIIQFYFAPRLNPTDLVTGIDGIVDAVYNCGGEYEMKIPTPNWYYPDIPKIPPGGTGRIRSRLNRIVAGFDLQDHQAVSSFMENLSRDKRFLASLEDSGEWASKYRIPLGHGISFVERYAHVSWDRTTVSLEVIPAIKLLSNPYYNPPNPERAQFHGLVGITKEKREQILATRSLRPIGRYTHMPGLMIDA